MIGLTRADGESDHGDKGMIGYTMLGSNDVEASGKFYDRLFAVIGAKRLMEFQRGPVYGVALDQPMLAICTSDDGASAFAGNGTMIALTVPDKEAVDRLHAMALKLGGKDVMAPGYIDPENPENRAFYGARFLDLDGNKLSVFCKAPA
jgi:predicted lactoylglutathione lyase